MDAVLAALIRYTIQSGAATAIVAAVSMFCVSITSPESDYIGLTYLKAATMPHNAVWIAVHFSISKLYTASTVAGYAQSSFFSGDQTKHVPSLNSRNPLKVQAADQEKANAPVAIHISTERARHVEPSFEVSPIQNSVSVTRVRVLKTGVSISWDPSRVRRGIRLMMRILTTLIYGVSQAPNTAMVSKCHRV